MTDQTIETRIAQLERVHNERAQITRANIIIGLAQYDKGAPGKNEIWRAKCDLAKALMRELEFRNVLDRQDFFLALWLAFPSMQNPLAYMPMRESICQES
jgi:hypothetical protein